MNTSDRDEGLPMPGEQFQRYLLVWHGLYIGSLALLLLSTLWNARAAFGGRELILLVSVVAQTVIYIQIMVRNTAQPTDGWVIPRLRAVLYLAVTLILWIVEWRLEPNFFWLIWLYLLHILSLIPVSFAFVIGILISMLIIFSEWVLDSGTRFAPSQITGLSVGIMTTVMAGIGLFTWFIGRVATTSSERAGLIQKLEAAQRDLEHARQQDTELATLRERERLARDLHDNLGHTLVALSVQLEAVQRLYRIDPERASAQVDQLKALTRASMEELRRSLAGLRSPGLGEHALRGAIEDLCQEAAKRTGLNIVRMLDEKADTLGSIMSEVIWRVVQEALTNVEKHAGAEQVEVTLRCEKAAVIVEICDNGQGMLSANLTQPGHYGVQGMRERVEGLGGKLTVQAVSPHGTCIEARLPVIEVKT